MNPRFGDQAMRASFPDIRAEIAKRSVRGRGSATGSPPQGGNLDEPPSLLIGLRRLGGRGAIIGALIGDVIIATALAEPLLSPKSRQ